MWSARSNPDVREKFHLNMSAVKKMTEHDAGGKLPERAKKKRKKY